MIRLKRVYEQPSEDDGLRILVDRLWPRGLSKDRAHIDLWLKETAPTDGLRKWFGHDVSRWDEFKQRYFLELEKQSEPVAQLMELIRAGTVTLVFAATDQEHNNAVAMKEFIESRLVKRH